MDRDEERRIEDAKKLAAGPLGQEVSKFPLRFAKPLFFGDQPTKDKPSNVNNGTVTLVDFGKGPIGITCAHVLSDYRGKLRDKGAALFQIGNLKLDPLEQLVAEDKELDLATVALTKDQADIITGDGEIGAYFFKPDLWPTPLLEKDSFVAFGGFPGKWRERISDDELVFNTFSVGSCQVASVSLDHFVCQFEREYWVKSLDLQNREDINDLGGLSGGPAFILKQLHWEFVGVIYEFSPEFDLIYLRPSNLIAENGAINRPHL